MNSHPRQRRPARRILVGMIEVSGQYRNLSQGLRAIGVEHDFITYSSSRYGYGGETKTPLLLRLSKRLRRTMSRSRLRTMQLMIAALVGGLQAIWAIGAVFRYDVFLFGYGTSLLPWNLDLPILRLLGKRVLSNIGHGSEARPPYLNGKWTTYTDFDDRTLQSLVHSANRIARKVHFIQKYSSLTIGSPYSSSFFAEGRMINRLALGRPVPPPLSAHVAKEAGLRGENRPLRILHCPSDRAVKGTDEILAAIARLRAKGHAIDFRLLENVSNAEVLKELALCDILIDQLYSDLPMPAISTEAAMYGKPAIVGGYDLHALQAHVPKEMWPPVYICQPDAIEAAIEELMADGQKRAAIGKALHDFVTAQWSLDTFARRYMRLVDNDIPVEWWFDPADIFYIYGCGQPLETTRHIIASLITFGGRDCLHLRRPEIIEKNPWLEGGTG